MSGFYTVINATVKQESGDRLTDYIPVCIVLYDPLKQKTYTRLLVDGRCAKRLNYIVFKMHHQYDIEGIIDLRKDIVDAGYRMRLFRYCKMLNRPGRTLNALCKEVLGKRGER